MGRLYVDLPGMYLLFGILPLFTSWVKFPPEFSFEFFPLFFASLMEGINLLVSSGTASAIAGDRLCMVKRKTARDDTKVCYTTK